MGAKHLRVSEELLRRIQAEYMEMQGLHLTEPQARRLWGLDEVSCGAVLGALINAKFLVRTPRGAYVRVEQANPLGLDRRSRQDGRHRLAVGL